MPIKNLPSFDGIDDGTKKKPENPFGTSGSFGDALSSLFGSIPDMPDLDIDDEEEDEDEVEEETSYTQPQKSKKTASIVDDVYLLSNQLKASILKYSKGRITSDEFKTSLKTNLLVGSISSETVNDFVDNTNFDTNYNSVVKEINNFFTLIAEDFDTNGLQNLEGCESYFTQYANNQDELVNHLTDSINDFVSFIAGCPGSDDFKEDIEDSSLLSTINS